MTIKNLTKEEMILYQVLAVVEDPPAVASFSIESKAREQISYHTPIERYIEEDGVYEVASTVPIVTCPEKITISEGIPDTQLDLDVYAGCSGVTMGTITVREVTKHVCVVCCECRGREANT